MLSRQIGLDFLTTIVLLTPFLRSLAVERSVGQQGLPVNSLTGEILARWVRLVLSGSDA
jgi:hypothetical protein